MIIKQLNNNIFYLGVNDQSTLLFEALWPIPQGISYNCYLINDEKTVLIDTVKKEFNQELITAISSILKDKPLDYLVINHMEPDHSGTLSKLKQLYPNLTVVGNHKTVSFMQGFYDIAETGIKQVATGDKLALGKYNLEFIQTAMVHWPESMVTYETVTHTLFSSDLFGGYKAVEDQPFADDRLDLEIFIDEARQYFATVLGATTRAAHKTLVALTKLNIQTIAPGHGLVWQKKAKQIMSLYQDWAEFKAKPGVTIVYGSMYGFTQEIAQLMAEQLKQEKIPVNLLNVSQTNLAALLNSIWQYQGLIIGSCTYNNGLFPVIKTLLDALADRKLKNKYLGIFSSYSWTGGAMRFLTEFAENSKLELIQPQFETQYKLNQESKKAALTLAKNMAKALKN